MYLCHPGKHFLSGLVKCVPFTDTCESQYWQANMAKELIMWREKEVIIDGFTSHEIEEILTNICIFEKNNITFYNFFKFVPSIIY